MNIIVGLPAYNEEKTIAKLIVKLQKISDQIIVCNDGSSDLTGPIAEKLGATVINHSKNLGYGASIRSIFLKAKELHCDMLVTFDADGQHRVEDIPNLLQPILDDKADIVIGSRFLNESEDLIPKYRKFGIKTITTITNKSTGVKITDSQSGFRAYNNNVLNKITPSDYGMGVSTEILIKASKQNFRITEVPITVFYNDDTSTHHPVSHGLGVIVSTIKFTSIEHPLKFYAIPGIIFLIIGVFFMVWTIQLFSETRQVITNISLMGIGGTLLGVFLLITGIILFSLISVVRERQND